MRGKGGGKDGLMPNGRELRPEERMTRGREPRREERGVGGK